MPFSARQAPDEEHVRRVVRLADRLRDLDAARDHAHLARAELARRVGEGLRGDDHEPRAAQDRPDEPRRAPGELDVGAPELDDERLPGRERREPRREPVRVDEVGVPRGSPRRPREARRGRPAAAARATAARAGCRRSRARRRARSAGTTAGETTSTSTPARAHALDRVARRTAPRRPASSRGYEVVRTTTFTGARRAKTTGAASASIANA